MYPWSASKDEDVGPYYMHLSLPNQKFVHVRRAYIFVLRRTPCLHLLELGPNAELEHPTLVYIVVQMVCV